MRELFFLTCGQLKTSALVLSPRVDLRSMFGTTTLAMTVAVVVRANGDIVLVDSGWSEATCGAAAASLGRLPARILGSDARPEDAIATQLRGLDLDPRRVTTVIATHLHLDHVGGIGDFANAELVCSARELCAYLHGPRDFGYRRADLARGGRLRSVVLDGSDRYGFPSSHDLFGDGRVILLDAAGHTPGHVAVALRSDAGLFVHVGDAVYQAWEWREQRPSALGKMPGRNRGQVMRTLAALAACEADTERPTLVPSHDLEVFRTLRHRPA